MLTHIVLKSGICAVQYNTFIALQIKVSFFIYSYSFATLAFSDLNVNKGEHFFIKIYNSEMIFLVSWD